MTNKRKRRVLHAVKNWITAGITSYGKDLAVVVQSHRRRP